MAQDSAAGAGGLQATRVSLEELLHQFDAAAGSAAYSQAIRTEAQLEAARIRRRLEQGDFGPGDRIAVTVEGQAVLTDTFTVATGRVVVLPLVGDVSLRGILRSELQDRLRDAIAEVVLDPVVHTRPLIRVAVVGGVGRPGFYALPPHSQLGDVLMAAGGPTPAARLDRISIERVEEEIWEPGTLGDAMAEGRTLDELGIRSGDTFTIPMDSGRPTGEIIRWVLFGLPGLIVTASQIF